MVEDLGMFTWGNKDGQVGGVDRQAMAFLGGGWGMGFGDGEDGSQVRDCGNVMIV